MYAPTAAGAVESRPLRARAKITRISPSVATTSEKRWAGLARWWVEMLIAARANIAFAVIAPAMQPAIWAGRQASASRRERPPKAEATSETTGLKWPAETGPNMRMIANRPAAVAAAFGRRYSARSMNANRNSSIDGLGSASMAVDIELTPKVKRAKGERCCEPVVYPDVEREHAMEIALLAKALGDPIRLQLVDVLRRHAGKVCVCELVPLFDVSQPTVSHHLKILRDAGIVGSERQGLWAYYYVLPGALDQLSAWLGT